MNNSVKPSKYGNSDTRDLLWDKNNEGCGAVKV
jgi:hypothetical protein